MGRSRTDGFLSGALPLVELGVAVALLVPASATAGAVAALALLVVFSVAVAGALQRGRPVGCGCFGSRHQRPVSHTTLVRNIKLQARAAAT